MSYPPRNNNEVAIPTWELTKKQLINLSKKHIIAKAVSSGDMRQKIRELMYPMVEAALAGEDFKFLIPKIDEKHVSYNEKLCFPLLKRGDCVTRDFYDAKCTRSTAMTAWILRTLYKNLESGDVFTIRDLFYRCSVFFRNQRTSDAIVIDICLMLECTRISLGLVSEEKGSVCGMIKITFKDERILDCKYGAQIPRSDRISDIVAEEDIDYIVVVEKGTIYNYLQRHNFHTKNKCITMTANGFPDINSRHFLKQLQQYLNVPVIGVVDPDASGLEIMKTYAQGSMNLAHENFNLAVPSLIWAGISLADIEECGVKLGKHNSDSISGKDKTALDHMLEDKYMKLTPRWRSAVERVLAVKKKVKFEVLHEKGYDYVANNLLPKLISRALNIQKEPDKNSIS